MYTVSQCDVFRFGELYYPEMLDRSRYDHFWVVGEDVTVIPELFRIQQTVPSEVRLFRDSSTRTVAGVLLNKGVNDLTLESGEFSDSSFKGSTFMNIRRAQALDIVCIGKNQSLSNTMRNRLFIINDAQTLPELVKDKGLSEYFYLIPPDFTISPYFEFDARVTALLDCHYAWFAERDGVLTHQGGITLMNRRLVLGESSEFLRYEGYLELDGFSGTVGT